eukprot:TRINITY_DN25941_c0_g2_i1.p1 TRINITY_DN25941_c0_g2~~TRINITY_DN25941_c0_g2_i1.p1  ORF type:complete len:236 (+),score=17.46 TRINITY_DN25941_c0_g2_i1:85-792(+)
MDNRPIEQPPGDWLARSYVCGYFASTAMLIVLMCAFMASLLLAGTDAGWAQRLTDNTLTVAAKNSPFTSITLHFMAGLMLAMGYGAFFHHKVQGPSWQKGICYAMGPFLLSVLVFFPMVGAGVMGFKLGAGPLPLMGNMVLHGAYGLTLGVTYGYLCEHGTSVVNSSATKAAVGLTAGALLGFLVAYQAAGGAGLPLGINVAWFEMSGALVGSALGCLVGLVAGQSGLTRPLVPS